MNEDQNMINNIIHKIKNSQVHSEPFEHLIIDNFLPNDLYKKIATELQEQDFYVNYKKGDYGGKERFAAKMHPVNYKRLLATDSTNVINFTKCLIQNHEKFYSAIHSKLLTERFTSDYFFHLSMIKDEIGYKIAPHTDAEMNIFTILFYVPLSDVNKNFGLHVYDSENGKPTSGENLDFIPNRMIIFAPSRPNEERPPTWHEVKKISNEIVGSRNSFQMFFYGQSSLERIKKLKDRRWNRLYKQKMLRKKYDK